MKILLMKISIIHSITLIGSPHFFYLSLSSLERIKYSRLALTLLPYNFSEWRVKL